MVNEAGEQRQQSQALGLRRPSRCPVSPKMVSYAILVFLTSLGGYFCGNGIQAICPPTAEMSMEKLLPQKSDADPWLNQGPRLQNLALPTRPHNRCRRQRFIPLGGGIMEGSVYSVRLCRQNTTSDAFFDQLRLEYSHPRHGQSTVTSWERRDWDQLVDRLRNCYPNLRSHACVTPRGPDQETCPFAALLKDGYLLCLDSHRQLLSLRFSNVQLSRIESLVFVESALFWAP